ncbi:MAG: hypothetical protein PHD32_04525 [Eubacteriales bacterium]|nr:hypothetical protein [Eubacteriales bacterium]
MQHEQTRRQRFERLVGTYGKQIYAHAYEHTHDAAAANEVTARVVRALYRAVSAQEEGELSQWVNELTARELDDRELTQAVAARVAPAVVPPEPQQLFKSAQPQPAEAVTTQWSPAAQKAQEPPAVEEPRRRRKGRGGRAVGIVLLVLAVLAAAWFAAGLLMAQGVLPTVDLGYTFFNTRIYPIFR